MADSDPRRILYRLGDVTFSKADIEHQLLGKFGFNLSSGRWLLTDELVHAISMAIELETPSSTIGVLSPYMLASMFGTAASPPRHRTVHRIFEHKSRQVGVVHLPPSHWIFADVTVRADRLSVRFVDSLSVLYGAAQMRAAAVAFVERYYPEKSHALDFRYEQAAIQVNPFDCGVLALDALSRVLNHTPLPPASFGSVENTAVLRVWMGGILERHARRLSDEEIKEESSRDASKTQHPEARSGSRSSDGRVIYVD